MPSKLLVTDIRQVKMVLVVMAIVIAVASLAVSHVLIQDLSKEESNRMETWAQALHALNKADENTDLSLVLNVIQSNNTIPVIITDAQHNPSDYRNVRIKAENMEDSLSFLRIKALQMYKADRYIRISIGEEDDDCLLVCYDESLMLKRLATYPYIQLGVVLIFVIIAIFALLTSKRAEQNKVWVGLSKETAHQLGTPISSLMAWTEMLRETYPDDELIPEMEKDVKRLQLIADRFSKIGSLPELVETSLDEIVSHVMGYMDKRTSKSIVFTKELPSGDVRAMLCPQLFEWVSENLCKNAVDAMGGANGSITITISKTTSHAIVDVADTGKGIRKKDIDNVFRPGFTTKRRGWGLGLSLAKRIVEEYHHGRIYVKSSEVNKGTTFRIEIPLFYNKK